METRIQYERIRFKHPFRLAGVEEQLPPGTYQMTIEEERLDTLSLIAWRRTAVTLDIRRGGATEKVDIDLSDLRHVLSLDATLPASLLTSNAGKSD